MRKTVPVLLTVLVIGILTHTLHADFYEEGDWITYGDFRYVTAVLPVRGRVFFATTNGILRYDPRFDQWEYPYTVSTGMPQGVFSLMGYEEFGDVMWIMTPDSSTYRHKQFLKEWEKTRRPEQWGARPDLTVPERLPSYMMTGTTYQFDAAGKYVEDRRFRKYPVTATAETDRFDRWFGFHGLGLGVVRNRSSLLEPVRYGLNRYGAETVLRDPYDQTFWIGGIRPEKHGGITRWDPEKDTWEHFDADDLDRVDYDAVYDMAAGPRFVWMATDGGILRRSRDDGSFRMVTSFDGLSNEQVRALAVDGDTLWAGTRQGITAISLTSGLISAVNERRFRYLDVYDIAAADGRAYAATDRGILMFRRGDGGGKWEQVREPANRTPYEGRVLCADGNMLWCAGRDLLAAYYPDDDRWDYQHDPGAVVYAIAADTTNLWLGTSNGVLKYLKGTGMKKRYTVDDGLPHPAVHSIVLGDEYVWFGTGKGLTQFKWKGMHRTD